MKDRSITHAFDVEKQLTINLDNLRDTKSQFSIREQYNDNTSRYRCLVCDQILCVSFSVNDRVYFRHLPDSDPCDLKIAGFSQEIMTGYENVRWYKESERHIELKNKIGAQLYKLDKVLKESIDIDKKFIISSTGKRRPDVFCEFEGKKLAFEIQLSPLPPHYIKHRYEFYKENGIYLIWILDIKNNPLLIEGFQRDIKYIWEHQNLFELDESQEFSLKLICHYKQPFVYENTIRSKWVRKSSELEELTFEPKAFSVYLFHFEAIKKALSVDVVKRHEKYIERKQYNESQDAVNSLIQKLEFQRKQNWNLWQIHLEINSFNNQEVQILNDKAALNKAINGIPAFLLYFSKIDKPLAYGKMDIAELILTCDNLHFDINLKDHEGFGIIEYLYGNPSLQGFLYKLKPLIFKRGYRLTEFDKEYLQNAVIQGDAEYVHLRNYMSCDMDSEMNFVQKHRQFLLFIESSLQMKRLGSDVKSWVQYMMPILSNYKEYWFATRTILNKTNLGLELRRTDKKKTIERKIIEHKLETISQDYTISPLLLKLYPEIFMR